MGAAHWRIPNEDVIRCSRATLGEKKELTEENVAQKQSKQAFDRSAAS